MNKNTEKTNNFNRMQCRNKKEYFFFIKTQEWCSDIILNVVEWNKKDLQSSDEEAKKKWNANEFHTSVNRTKIKWATKQQILTIITS